ncbi:hypothetical protein AOLI_G00201440 [Acnodon oligacanthus]
MHILNKSLRTRQASEFASAGVTPRCCSAPPHSCVLPNGLIMCVKRFSLVIEDLQELNAHQFCTINSSHTPQQGIPLDAVATINFLEFLFGQPRDSRRDRISQLVREYLGIPQDGLECVVWNFSAGYHHDAHQ